MKNVFLGCIMILWATLSSAQDQCNLKLYGKVSDEHDGSILAYASLQVYLQSSFIKGVSANEEGLYEMGGLCPGEYEIIVSHIGCQPDTIFTELKASKELNIKLEHHWEDLQEVEVVENVQEANSESLSEEDKSREMGESMAKMLKSLPGVNTLQTGTNVSKPMIGGFSSNRVQIINHGIQHTNQNWGDEHAPEIDPFAYVNYTVIKGASAVRYGGGAIGGFVLVEPKPLRSDFGIGGKLSGLYATNNGMYAPSLMLEARSKLIPQLAGRAQATYRRSANIKSPDYYQNNTGIEESNFSWTLGWNEKNWNVELYYSLVNSEIGIFSGAHVGNLTDLRNVIESGDPKPQDIGENTYDIDRPFQLITHEILRAKSTVYLDHGKISINAGRQFNIREEFDKEKPRNDEIAALNIPEFSLSLESYIANIAYEFEVRELNWEIGGGVISKENTVNSFVDFIPNYTSMQYNGFAAVDWEKGRWNFEGAARIDYRTMDVNKFIQLDYVPFEHEFTTTTLNLGFGREIGKKSRLHFNGSYSERAPEINELHSDGLHHGTASLEFGEPNLEKEKAISFRTEFESDLGALNVNVQAFIQMIEDFIYLEPDGFDLSTRGAFPLYQWKNTDATMRGFDVLMSYDFTESLSLQHKSSWLWANQGDQFLVNIPSNRFEHIIEYKLMNNSLKIYGSHLFVFKQNRYDPDVEIAIPPNAYQLVSLGALKDFELRKKINLRLGLKVNNLLDLAYRDYLNRFRYYADEMGRDVRFTLELKF